MSTPERVVWFPGNSQRMAERITESRVVGSPLRGQSARYNKRMADHTEQVRDKRSARLNNSWPEAFRIAILGEMVQIAVEGFSGPIDHLLELIDRNELDVTALSLT